MLVTPQEMNVPSKIGDFIIQKASWSNFPAEGPEDSWFLAHIYWNVSYNIISTKDKGFHVKAKANISKKSWVNPQCATKKLLRHEYGHYLICCLAGLTFRKKANELGMKITDGKQYQQACSKLLQKTISQFCEYQRRYDKQTYHYLNEKQQKQWEKDFSRKFAEFAENQKKNEEVRKIVDLPLLNKREGSRQKPRMQSLNKPRNQNQKTQNQKMQNRTNMMKMKKNVDSLIENYSWTRDK